MRREFVVAVGTMRERYVRGGRWCGMPSEPASDAQACAAVVCTCLRRAAKEDEEGERTVDEYPARDEQCMKVRGVRRPRSERDLDNAREVPVRVRPAYPRVYAVAPVCYQDVCADRDGTDDLDTSKRHEAQIETRAERGVAESGFEGRVLKELVVRVHVFDGENCVDYQSGRRLGGRMSCIRQYTSETTPIMTGQR